MGTWNIGPFDNDDALDGLHELAVGSIPVATFLEDTDYLEASEGAVIVALGALIVGLRPDEEENAKLEVFLNSLSLEDILRIKELLVLVQDKDMSELYELWEEAEELTEWQGTIQNIIQKWPA